MTDRSPLFLKVVSWTDLPKTSRTSRKGTHIDEVKRTKKNPSYRTLTHRRKLGRFGPNHDSRRVNKRDPVTGLRKFDRTEEGYVVSIRPTTLGIDDNSRQVTGSIEYTQ